jgi:hypothetical protein
VKKELNRAAEEVRASKIRALKSQRAQIPPRGGPDEVRLAALDDEITLWESTPIDAIIAEYR